MSFFNIKRTILDEGTKKRVENGDAGDVKLDEVAKENGILATDEPRYQVLTENNTKFRVTKDGLDIYFSWGWTFDRGDAWCEFCQDTTFTSPVAYKTLEKRIAMVCVSIIIQWHEIVLFQC